MVRGECHAAASLSMAQGKRHAGDSSTATKLFNVSEDELRRWRTPPLWEVLHMTPVGRRSGVSSRRPSHRGGEAARGQDDVAVVVGEGVVRAGHGRAWDTALILH
jgi:hypothetical protein